MKFALSAARLTKEELSRIESHLRDQYRGVFDEKMVKLHITEFVESSFADNLAAVIRGVGHKDDSLLDIGAGFGAFVLSCRRHDLDAKGYEIESFEVDISRARLRRAEPNADGSTVFKKGDAGRLPFGDGNFQIVTILNVLEHVPDYRAVLAEAARVLRPGGRLFVICPNYAALRKEAHYHVPWLPFFPRRFATAYLRRLGRNSRFFEQHIYYCSNWGVLYALNRLGLQLSNLDVMRLEHPELFSSRSAKQILNFLQRVRLLPALELLARISLYNPFKAAVTVVAYKPLSF